MRSKPQLYLTCVLGLVGIEWLEGCSGCGGCGEDTNAEGPLFPPNAGTTSGGGDLNIPSAGSSTKTHGSQSTSISGSTETTASSSPTSGGLTGAGGIQNTGGATSQSTGANITSGVPSGAGGAGGTGSNQGGQGGDEAKSGAGTSGSGTTGVGTTGSGNTTTGSGVGASGSLACGNGVREGVEDCDKKDVGGSTCQKHGFELGQLGCKVNCTFDESGCSNPVCHDGKAVGSEACDDGDLKGLNCESFSNSGTGVLKCLNCKIDASDCKHSGDCNDPIDLVLGTQFEDTDRGTIGNGGKCGSTTYGQNAKFFVYVFHAPADGKLKLTLASTADLAVHVQSVCGDGDKDACTAIGSPASSPASLEASVVKDLDVYVLVNGKNAATTGLFELTAVFTAG